MKDGEERKKIVEIDTEEIKKWSIYERWSYNSYDMV